MGRTLYFWPHTFLSAQLHSQTTRPTRDQGQPVDGFGPLLLCTFINTFRGFDFHNLQHQHTQTLKLSPSLFHSTAAPSRSKLLHRSNQLIRSHGQ
ncbi:hypothetical protein HanHA300_Chr03g0085901 [Helianthus annuus]|nr:hypothetical protein HanHA300_Chr03g0085901 [Helianthus annuus]KAJ0767564.1 hypothetical protein HanLR1_Chr03g0090811 [Helianthus annuus]